MVNRLCSMFSTNGFIVVSLMIWHPMVLCFVLCQEHYSWSAMSFNFLIFRFKFIEYMYHSFKYFSAQLLFVRKGLINNTSLIKKSVFDYLSIISYKLYINEMSVADWQLLLYPYNHLLMNGEPLTTISTSNFWSFKSWQKILNNKWETA